MKRKKKRPELNTNKVESGTFFPPVQEESKIGKADEALETETDRKLGEGVNSGDTKKSQEKETSKEEQTAAIQKKEEEKKV